MSPNSMEVEPPPAMGALYPRYCLVRKKSVISQGTASAIFCKVATVGFP